MADNETQAGEPASAPDGAKELEQVMQSADQVAAAAKSAATPQQPSLEFILDVTLQVTVEVGRARMTIQDLLQLGQGSVVELEKLAGEPLDIYINGKVVASGEAVIVNEKFGVRLNNIISHNARVDALAPVAAAKK